MADHHDLFEFPGSPDCPAPLTNELIAAAEEALGLRIPIVYQEVLKTCNGGKLRRNTFYTDRPTSWAENHVQIADLMGIGGENGIDARYGSDYLIEEWSYPRPTIVLWSGGSTAILLDYRHCGPEGEPPVIWIDMERPESEQTIVLASNFEAFIERLVECPT